MLAWFHDIWKFPERHVSLGWWIAFALASKPIWRALTVLPVWGSRFRKNQRAAKIRTLETLHQNTYGLVIYLAEDLVQVAFDFAGTCVGLAFVARSTSITAASVLLIICANLSSSIIGRGLRINGVLTGLKNYEATLAQLKET